MENSNFIFKYGFCIIGLVLLVQALIVFYEKISFIEKANVAQGIVLDSSSNDKTFAAFTTKGGKQITFSSYNNFGGYDAGKSIEVFYDPENPYNAKINSFSVLYLGVLILALMGSVFFVTGFSFFRSDFLKQKKIQFLKQNGRHIITKFSQLKLNVNEKANGSYPYIICSKWLDPETNKMYVFESENIWLDPTEFDVKNEIMVLIDPNNIKTYYMDISFVYI
ncbi:DUF3592 domain-containing protein [Flavobacterium anhuiense]|uniref:DUF3592 domain-containing protein n=1 Tax=Flavobacterium anhuiense TaxID=459526 RepID=UPI003D956827